jgi:hypothetical protein
MCGLCCLIFTYLVVEYLYDYVVFIIFDIIKCVIIVYGTFILCL